MQYTIIVIPQCHVVKRNVGQHTEEYKYSDYQYEYIEVGPTVHPTHAIGSPEVISDDGTIRAVEKLFNTTALIEFLN